MSVSMTDLLGHLAYAMLIGGSLVRTLLPMRLLMIGSGISAVAYGAAVGANVEIFWEAMFTLVNVVQVGILIRERHRVQLTDEEEALRRSMFGQLSVVEFHRLIRSGRWASVPKGALLTSQGDRVDSILLLTAGEAVVRVDGEITAYCRPGDSVGEMAFVSGRPATATTETTVASRYLVWSFEDLRSLLRKDADTRSALQSVFTTNLIDKLSRDDFASLASSSVDVPRGESSPSVP